MTVRIFSAGAVGCAAPPRGGVISDSGECGTAVSKSESWPRTLVGELGRGGGGGAERSFFFPKREKKPGFFFFFRSGSSPPPSLGASECASDTARCRSGTPRDVDARGWWSENRLPEAVEDIVAERGNPGPLELVPTERASS